MKCLFSRSTVLDFDRQILSVFSYRCVQMSVSAKKNQQKVMISFIPLILDSDFSMSNNFQIQNSVIARPIAYLLLPFEDAVQVVIFYLDVIYCPLFCDSVS